MDRLVYADTLPGQNGLVNPEATRRHRQQTAICWDLVTHCYNNYITRNEVCGMNAGKDTLAQCFGLVWGVFLQSLCIRTISHP
jgi:hypothetical protein